MSADRSCTPVSKAIAPFLQIVPGATAPIFTRLPLEQIEKVLPSPEQTRSEPLQVAVLGASADTAGVDETLVAARVDVAVLDRPRARLADACPDRLSARVTVLDREGVIAGFSASIDISEAEGVGTAASEDAEGEVDDDEAVDETDKDDELRVLGRPRPAEAVDDIIEDAAVLVGRESGIFSGVSLLTVPPLEMSVTKLDSPTILSSGQLVILRASLPGLLEDHIPPYSTESPGFGKASSSPSTVLQVPAPNTFASKILGTLRG